MLQFRAGTPAEVTVCPRILWKIHSEELKRTPSRAPHTQAKLWQKHKAAHPGLLGESTNCTQREEVKGCEFWNWSVGWEAKAHTALTRNWSDFQNSFLELTHSCLPVTPTPGTRCLWCPWGGMPCVSLEHTHTTYTHTRQTDRSIIF